ncbi:MAG TPA: alpha/beta fold hydrolase [Armatimonadota bacterium]|nr:alpha/beta fold hydrolase [Armatimonadota bacterium]
MSQLWTIEQDRVGPAATPVYLVRLMDQVPRPLILCVHGLGGSKDHFLPFAMSLAARGFVVALVDAVNHGERRHPDFENVVESRFLPFFHECVMGTADEIPELLNALQSRPGIAPGSAGMTGFSMGGYITFRACCIESRLAAAAPCGASGDWSVDSLVPGAFVNPVLRQMVEAVNPAAHVDRFPPRALLIQNGVLDDTVPITQARRFLERGRPAYASCPDRLRWIEYPDLGHQFAPAMQDQVERWMVRWLSADGGPRTEDGEKVSV